MRVIITGGTGLIGRALSTDLAGAGHEVIVLSRNAGRAIGLAKGVRVEGWDGSTAAGWGSLAEGATIVNLAGEGLASGRWTDERKRKIIDSRVSVGKALVDAARRASFKPAAIIQMSAVGYYGPRGDEELTEESAPGQDWQSRVVLQWEASTASVDELGIRRAVVRSGVVLSTEGGALPRMVMPFRFYVGGRIGSGCQWLSWIHVADEVAGLRYLVENEAARGTYILTSPEPVRNARFSAAVGRALSRPSWFPIPAFAMRLLFGEMATVLLDGQRVLPKRLQAEGFRFRFPSSEDALDNLLRK